MKETGDIEIKFVPANLVEYNEGQIEGVPENYMIRTEEQEAEEREGIVVTHEWELSERERIIIENLKA